MSDAAVSIDSLSQNSFRIGQVLAKTFSVYFSRFISLTSLGIAVHIPSILIVLYVPATTPEEELVQGLLDLGYSLFATPLATAVILYGAFQQMRGGAFSLRGAIARGLSRFFPLSLLVLLWTLGVMLGFLALIIPGILLCLMWAVAMPCCVVERTGPIRSLGRSRELTRGVRWKLFGLFLETLVIIIIFAAFFGVVFFALAGFEELAQALQEAASPPWPLLAFQAVISGVQFAFFSVLVVVTYYHLRRHKEGVDIDAVASVFD